MTAPEAGNGAHGDLGTCVYDDRPQFELRVHGSARFRGDTPGCSFELENCAHKGRLREAKAW